MCDVANVPADRQNLGFAPAVRRTFSFLETFGFRSVEMTSTLASYANEDLVARVYHGRRSYELGFEIGRGQDVYPLSAVIRVQDPEAADNYRNYAAVRPEAVSSGLRELAQLVERYGERALLGDEVFFELLRQQRLVSADDFAIDVLSRQIRPKAEAAFRDHRYDEAAKLYERILPRLTPVERQKLELARRRAG